MSEHEPNHSSLDIGNNLVLKENYTFLVADDRWMVGARAALGTGREQGLYNRDTRYLSRYAWRFNRTTQPLLQYSPRPDRSYQHLAVIEGPSQLLAVKRHLKLAATALEDGLVLENSSLEEQRLELKLEVAADFADLFVARGWHQRGQTQVRTELTTAADHAVLHLEHVASDGLEQAVQLRFSPAPHHLDDSGASWRFDLAAGASTQVTVAVRILDPLEHPHDRLSYRDWEAQFVPLTASPEQRPVLQRAITDLRALLLFTDEGPIAAAGIPWYVTAFGRDSLITALMLQAHHPAVARGTLRYLAKRQGTEHDALRAEAPGKILHEVRQGELARTGVVPFGLYYGTIDATALFVILLGRMAAAGELDLVRELRPNLDAALEWLTGEADPDGDGFLEFSAAEPGQGLTVQSWKDSHDALSHADGSLASGAIAVSEVQGYAYAAYLAAADCFQLIGEEVLAQEWRSRAVSLKERFHAAFWLPQLGTYALALDHDKRPLEVLASDAGQLLWSGIVPPAVAPTLVATLMSPELFSGWGIRTLGVNERRYNPLSYHNGSVWPHDTALIAAGMNNYGFVREAHVLRDALFDLAASQPDLRPPELVAGYPRDRGRFGMPPVPYPAACRPQAWSSAALVYLSGLDATLPT